LVKNIHITQREAASWMGKSFENYPHMSARIRVSTPTFNVNCRPFR